MQAATASCLLVRQSSDENLVLNRLGDSHGGRARAVVALDGKDLVVVVSEVKTSVLPGLEVSTGVDGTAGALVATDRPKLLEGLAVTLDGRSVGTGADVDVVDGTIDVDLTALARAGRGVVGTEALNDVVLDQRAAGPAVDGEVAVAVGLVRARVLDSSVTVSIQMLRQRSTLGYLTWQHPCAIPFHRRGCRFRSIAC
jgi:hypothetical protein